MNYSEHFSEPESRVLPVGRWDRAVVLPLHGEGNIAPLLQSLEAAAGGPTLAIAVVNARAGASPLVHERNQAVLRELGNHRSANLSVFIVDRASPGLFFPEDQGVGLARKIGCDVALALWKTQQLGHPQVLTTDGDAAVDADYFRASTGTMAAGYFDHRHEVDDPEAYPLLLYEIWLRYYVQGLRYAKSPYAFSTVGSTLSLDLRAYEKARGFPRRDAGEDFYLMNKLAKLGKVCALPGRVRLRYRLSQRVPFGTGAGTRKIRDQLARGETFTLYAPKSFEALKEWLAWLSEFPRHRTVDFSGMAPQTVAALERLGARAALEQAAKTRPSESDCLRHLNDWFDGFRTLKFVHFLREDSFPEIEFREALRTAPFAGWDLPPRELLERMRQADDAVHFPSTNSRD